MAEWFYTRNGKKCGPVPTAELKAMAASGSLQPSDQVWREGLQKWKVAGNVIGLFPSQKSAQSISSPPPLPKEHKADINEGNTEKAAPSSSVLEDATPFDELFSRVHRDSASQTSGTRPANQDIRHGAQVNAVLNRFSANQFTWGYRIAMGLGILGVFLPWYNASSVFKSSIAAGSSSASVSGILMIWGILALFAGGWGLVVSFIKPKWLTHVSCAAAVAVFSIIAVLQFNAFSPAGVNVHSSYGGFSAFGSLTSGVGVGAWLTLISGIVAAALSFFEKSALVRHRTLSPAPDAMPHAPTNPRNNNHEQTPTTSGATELGVGRHYRLYKSAKTPISRRLIVFAVICCLIVISAFLINRFQPGIFGNKVSALTGVVVADAYIEPILLDQMGAMVIAQALIKAAVDNPKATTIVVKLWLKSSNRTSPNLIYTHTFNAIAVESAREIRDPSIPMAFLMDADEHGVTYGRTLGNSITQINRGW